MTSSAAPWWQSTALTHGVSTTFRMHENYATWQEALRFVIGLRNLKSKPRIRATAIGWQVTYEPELIAFNYVTP